MQTTAEYACHVLPVSFCTHKVQLFTEVNSSEFSPKNYSRLQNMPSLEITRKVALLLTYLKFIHFLLFI